MQDFITMLPTIFCYWTSFLIIWSLVAAYGMHQIMDKISLCGFTVRRSDKVAFWMTILGTTILSTVLFGLPELTIMIMDVMIGLDFWYTLFMIYLSGSSLSSWPLISRLEIPRDADNSAPRCLVIYK